MKVENMLSPQSGRPIANQFIITDPNTGVEVFQSYKSTIAKKIHGRGLLLDSTYWNYSRTTSKYRNQFTGLTTKETESKIKSGEIQLVNLN